MEKCIYNTDVINIDISIDIDTDTDIEVDRYNKISLVYVERQWLMWLLG